MSVINFEAEGLRIRTTHDGIVIWLVVSKAYLWENTKGVPWLYFPSPRPTLFFYFPGSSVSPFEFLQPAFLKMRISGVTPRLHEISEPLIVRCTFEILKGVFYLLLSTFHHQVERSGKFRHFPSKFALHSCLKYIHSVHVIIPKNIVEEIITYGQQSPWYNMGFNLEFPR